MLRRRLRPGWEAKASEVHRRPGGRRAHAVAHRDFHPGNTIWDGSRLAGIVDWTTASRGPTAADLAHWRANLGTRHGIAVADRVPAAYAAAGGTTEHQAWWDVRILLDFVADMDTAAPADAGSVDTYLAGLLDRL